MRPAALDDPDRAALAELTPLLRRAADLDPNALVRLRLTPRVATALVRLPFGVLVSRAVARPGAALAAGHGAEPGAGGPVRDLTVRAAEVLAWVADDTGGDAPPARDGDWRGGLPPQQGWARLEVVPDDVIRPIVRQGALTLKEAAAREGVPGAQPRQEVADTLLDSVVLQVSGDGGQGADVTLRALSALTRMGFLPRDGHANVETAGRWVRVVAAYGTVYLERPGSGLGLLGH